MMDMLDGISEEDLMEIVQATGTGQTASIGETAQDALRRGEPLASLTVDLEAVTGRAPNVGRVAVAADVDPAAAP
jgi:hypothetical protein